MSMESLEFSGGKAEVAEVTRCTGDVSAYYLDNAISVHLSFYN